MKDMVRNIHGNPWYFNTEKGEMYMSCANCLYPQLSFFDGVASSLDIGNTFLRYNDSLDGQTIDYIALSLDWHAVGQDLEDAMMIYGKETSKQ